jgi:hypothetical protein
MRLAAAGLFAAALCGAGAASASPFAVVLHQPPPLAKDADSLPRIVSPKTAATDRINADLARADAQWREDAVWCRKNATSPKDVYLARGFTVTMRGPGFFALSVSDESDCGGAHPNNDVTARVYDLDSGRRVDWLKLFPASARMKRPYDDASEELAGMFTSPVLQAVYLKTARTYRPGKEWADCDYLEQPGRVFDLMPNAESGGLDMEPADLPRVIMACGDSVTISPTELRRLGADPRLIGSIEQSHLAWKAWKATHKDR